MKRSRLFASLGLLAVCLASVSARAQQGPFSFGQQEVVTGGNSSTSGPTSNDSTGISSTVRPGVSVQPANATRVTPSTNRGVQCGDNAPYLSAPASNSDVQCTFEPMYDNETTSLPAGSLNQSRVVTYKTQGHSCDSNTRTGKVTNVVGSVVYVCTVNGWVPQGTPTCSGTSMPLLGGDSYSSHC